MTTSPQDKSSLGRQCGPAATELQCGRHLPGGGRLPHGLWPSLHSHVTFVQMKDEDDMMPGKPVVIILVILFSILANLASVASR